MEPGEQQLEEEQIEGQIEEEQIEEQPNINNNIIWNEQEMNQLNEMINDLNKLHLFFHEKSNVVKLRELVLQTEDDNLSEELINNFDFPPQFTYLYDFTDKRREGYISLSYTDEDMKSRNLSRNNANIINSQGLVINTTIFQRLRRIIMYKFHYYITDIAMYNDLQLKSLALVKQESKIVKITNDVPYIRDMNYLLNRQCGLYITVINLSHNLLTTIPRELFFLIHVTELNLSANYLNSIPDTINYMQKLIICHIGGNRITKLPTQITELSKLVTLYVNNNKLRRLPTNIGRMSSLCHVVASHNRIRHIPESITRLSRLQLFVLSYNRLVDIPIYLYKLPLICKINLDANYISHLFFSKNKSERICSSEEERQNVLNANNAMLYKNRNNLLNMSPNFFSVYSRKEFIKNYFCITLQCNNNIIHSLLHSYPHVYHRCDVEIKKLYNMNFNFDVVDSAITHFLRGNNDQDNENNNDNNGNENNNQNIQDDILDIIYKLLTVEMNLGNILDNLNSIQQTHFYIILFCISCLVWCCNTFVMFFPIYIILAVEIITLAQIIDTSSLSFTECIKKYCNNEHIDLIDEQGTVLPAFPALWFETYFTDNIFYNLYQRLMLYFGNHNFQSKYAKLYIDRNFQPLYMKYVMKCTQKIFSYINERKTHCKYVMIEMYLAKQTSMFITNILDINYGISILLMMLLLEFYMRLFKCILFEINTRYYIKQNVKQDCNFCLHHIQNKRRFFMQNTILSSLLNLGLILLVIMCMELILGLSYLTIQYGLNFISNIVFNVMSNTQITIPISSNYVLEISNCE